MSKVMLEHLAMKKTLLEDPSTPEATKDMIYLLDNMDIGDALVMLKNITHLFNKKCEYLKQTREIFLKN
jgi:hypothetical protein